MYDIKHTYIFDAEIIFDGCFSRTYHGDMDTTKEITINCMNKYGFEEAVIYERRTDRKLVTISRKKVEN